MKKIQLSMLTLGIISSLLFSCAEPASQQERAVTSETLQATSEAKERYGIYVPFKLDTDISVLSESEKQMLPLMIKAAQIMDDLFWKQAYGNKEALLSQAADEDLKRFLEINYGPYDRLNANKPIVEGIGAKPLGAQYYPEDMTKEEFEAAQIPDKKSLYTLIRRDEDGKLISIPFSQAYKAELEQAAGYIRQAAEIAQDSAFQKYLSLRADALLTDEYYQSDMAWMDSKTSRLDLIIGPIENYEDKLYNYKAAFEAYVVVRDMEWGEKLAKYAPLLPMLQKAMPVAQAYKAENPGTDAHLVAADVVYYAGDCNSGSKTIAVNLPNDEKIQQEKGTRRTQIKNAMRAKFDKILVPIANELIAEDQLQHITFDAFFANTMFHEVAHGLGIKNTINGKGTVRETLLEEFSALEEGKADILGLYMVSKLFEMNEYQVGQPMDNYVTFMASIFRSVRFGASSAHGKANMLRFNYFLQKGAFSRDETSGKYRINMDKMTIAMNDLTALILQLQGDGDYNGVQKLMAAQGSIQPQLQADLDRLTQKGIPVDVVFEQGIEVLGI